MVDSFGSGEEMETLAGTVGDRANLPATRSGRPLEPGDRVSRYLVLERVGAGGMGLVYAAYDPELDRKVALKLVHPSARGTASESTGQRRLLREAQAMAKVSHVNVLPVHDAGEVDAGVFLAMEFVEGETLAQWLAEAPRSWSEVLEVFVAAGRGLEAAHASGLIHRDFKPENVMIGDDGRVRVMDFGLARAHDDDPRAATHVFHDLELRTGEDEDLLAVDDATRSDESVTRGEDEEAPLPPPPDFDDDATPRLDDATPRLGDSLTRTGAVLGTPAYMSPEQHLGKSLDARSDQFSFAVALYEGLTGERPFRGDNPRQVAVAVVHGDRRPKNAAEVPSRIHAALDRALSVDPGARWPSMTAFLEALSFDPSQARRRWLTGAGVLAGAAALGLGLLQHEPTPDPCATAGDAADTTWNDERRAAIRRAFEASETGFASASADRSLQRIDTYVDAWKKARRDACEATYARHEQSEALFDRRVACFDHALDEVDALATVFADADAKVVERSVAMASELSPLAACADREALLAAVPPPKGEALAAEVEATREALSLAKASFGAGRFEAAAEATRAVMPPDDYAYPPLVAEAKVALGRYLAETGDFEASEALLEEGYFLARAEAHDTVALTAASYLTQMVGQRGDELDEGFEWGRHARAEVERGGSSPLDAALLDESLGTLHAKKGEYDESLARFEAALAVREAELGQADPRTARALNNVAIALYYLGRAEDSLAAHQRAYEARLAALGPAHPDVAQSLMNQGITYFQLGRHDEGIEVMQRALELERAAGAGAHKLANTLNNLGNLLASAGRDDEAIGRFREAITLQEKAHGPDHPAVADSLINLALSLDTQQKYDEALPLVERAVAIYEAESPEGIPFAIALGNLALVAGHAGQREDALLHQRRSLEIKLAALEPGHPSLGFAYLGLAESLLDLDRPREAAVEAEKAVETWSKGEVDPMNLAAAQYTLAKTLERSNPRRARELAAKARATYADKPGEAAEADRAEMDAFLTRVGG